MENGKIPTTAKTKTRRGLALEINTELMYLSPTPITTLLVVVILSILPFLAVNISQFWLAIVVLSVLSVLLFGVWSLRNPFAKPVFIEVGRTEIGGGKADIEYKVKKYEQDYGLLAIVIIPGSSVKSVQRW